MLEGYLKKLLELIRASFLAKAWIVGKNKRFIEATLKEQDAILKRAEKKVYKGKTIEEFEHNNSDRFYSALLRTVAQYQCNTLILDHFLFRVLREFSAIPTLILFLIEMIFPRKVRFPQVSTNHEFVVFCFAPHHDRLISQGMHENYIPKKHYFHGKEFFLGDKEKKFFFKIIKNYYLILLYPYLLLNIIRWLGYYGYVLRKFSPKEIGNFFDGTPSCSLITNYLENLGIRHINFQHGERLGHVDYAFSYFHVCYVWGTFFKNDLVRRKVDPRTIRLFVPSYIRKLVSFKNIKQPRKKTLLLLAPFSTKTEISLKSMNTILRCIDNEWEVIIRRHPNECEPIPHLDYIQRKLKERRIPVQIDIGEKPLSGLVSDVRVCVSMFSCALLETWLAGCKIVYVPPCPEKEMVIGKFSGNKNVFYMDQEDSDCRDLQEFVKTPFELSGGHAGEISYLFAI